MELDWMTFVVRAETEEDSDFIDSEIELEARSAIEAEEPVAESDSEPLELKLEVSWANEAEIELVMVSLASRLLADTEGITEVLIPLIVSPVVVTPPPIVTSMVERTVTLSPEPSSVL
ncbi:hypothetical protein WICPIJ_003404 [Wickerhamomyces pijperi]|uniref:Uncharacterized protein n=1 Tax=Wickerhamomyces pijperi TaxID=599730 RepID=A0A9P8TNW9_WICPI|nr:hypothetical protein WICPIJ_003404 [Wickerhamomyces pijperi]